MLLALDEVAREDGSLVGLIAFVPGLLLLELYRILLCGEDIVRFVDAALGSLLLFFEFLQHSLNPLVLIVLVACSMSILLPYFLVPFSDFSLAQLLLGLFHESPEHVLSVFLAFLPQVLLDKLVKAILLRLVQQVVAI